MGAVTAAWHHGTSDLSGELARPFSQTGTDSHGQISAWHQDARVRHGTSDLSGELAYSSQTGTDSHRQYDNCI
ncbi:hypothetical protein D5086_009978 [Populus alba]|uniref:Uncharacterized protein n=1 Tax=Populus alba TaxID=43335 RepID=A0ACC4C829_POPAL